MMTALNTKDVDSLIKDMSEYFKGLKMIVIRTKSDLSDYLNGIVMKRVTEPKRKREAEPTHEEPVKKEKKEPAKKADEEPPKEKKEPVKKEPAKKNGETHEKKEEPAPVKRRIGL